LPNGFGYFFGEMSRRNKVYIVGSPTLEHKKDARQRFHAVLPTNATALAYLVILAKRT